MKYHAFILSSVLAVAACTKQESTTEALPPEAASEALTSIFKAVPEGEPVLIHDVRATAKPGDKLLIKGRIMGSISPFVEGRAAFMLADEELITACSDMGDDDHCETPWDACCDSKEDLLQGTATIQVLGANGRVLKEGIEGVEGLEKLSRVVIDGVVAEGSGADNLVINATGIELVE